MSYWDILNTASRFCGTASAGEVVCSAVFADRVEASRYGGGVHIEPLPPVTLKGKGEMQVFLLTPGADTHYAGGLNVLSR
ncbi:hypothetical protein T484DRAFT_1810042 [Baffinella frigidus]|nr:hypothetical protein T484DRAFT_1810042 [Cryptophyta sp. CCMP2293]